jgi:hypothetical protein
MEAQQEARSRHWIILASVLVAGAIGLLLSPHSADAAPLSPFWISGENCGNLEKIFTGECGGAAGETRGPTGVATDPLSGNVFVLDRFNGRIDEFSPWGVFQKAWGWGVVNGAAQPQTCGPAASPPTSGCQSGIAGGGSGQINGGIVNQEFPNADPRGIATDSAGNVYVYEAKACLGVNCESFVHANRVQKFTSEGDFLLTFGAGVNLSKVKLREEQEANSEPVTVSSQEENLCTAASGDECGPGVQGGGPEEFGGGPLSGVELGTSVIDVGPNDHVYVGGQERIQEFDSQGVHISTVNVPGKMIQSLAVAPSGEFFLAYADFLHLFGSEPNVFKLSAAGAPLCTIEVDSPQAVAVSNSGAVYVMSKSKVPGPFLLSKYTSACQTTGEAAQFGETLGQDAFGLATSEACGIPGADVFASVGPHASSALMAFGPPPNATVCPPPLASPTVTEQYATSVDSASATLKAKIDPQFWPDTRYYVEYGVGKCSEGGCLTDPLPPGLLLTATTTSDALPTPSLALRDLSPDTEYHYRFVAKSGGGGPVYGTDPGGEGPEGATFAAGVEASFHTFPRQTSAKTDCPNQVFRTGPSAFLPDCRAYEMVSPVDKNNANVSGSVTSQAKVSLDGERATFQSPRAFADAEGAPFAVQYLAQRDLSSGWLTRSISAPRESISMYQAGTTYLGNLFRSFSDDLCSALVLQDVRIALAPGAFTGAPNLYKRDNCGPDAGTYELITTVAPPGFVPEGNQFIEYFPLSQGSSDDGSRTVFKANATLTDDACDPSKDVFQVYESTPSGLRLVSRLNEPISGPQTLCVHSSAGTGQGDPGAINDDSVHNAVSADGGRVYWTASTSSSNQEPAKGSGGGSGDNRGHLYLRANSDQEQSSLSKAGKCVEPEKACTYKVSELVSAQPARFLTADENGGRALFTVDPDGNGPETTNLYEFEASGEGALVTKATLVVKGLVGFMGASESLDRQYFASREALAGAGANDQGAEAAPGKANVYLYERGVGFHFVATLADLDALNVEDVGAPRLGPFSVLPRRHASRVSESGEQALFMSTAPLTGIDNTDVDSGHPDTQVYLYDSSEGTDPGQLLCVSCRITGARPSGREIAPQLGPVAPLWAAAQIPGWTEEQQPNRVLSSSGERVFFESFDSLVPRDTNAANDVYQWERADNRTDCETALGGEIYSPQSQGCLSLISSGQNKNDSFFIDANQSGSSVFFSTRASLLVQDPGLTDIYVARQGGGFPPPPPRPPECEGETCQSPPGPPSDPTPASAGFKGPGNVGQPVKCRKGQRKVTNKKTRKTRCAKVRKGKGANKPRAHKSGRAGR